ncbi:MAG: hypothetical protein D6815_12825 [Candidatus Dadabacteria bacterium]|nr:MAG: hypothetical protein D6815_12825 [Candidatus Dadabacteria bacterium]
MPKRNDRLFLLAAVLVVAAACGPSRNRRPIAGALEGIVPISRPPSVRAVHGRVPKHPYLAPPGRATMHADSYNSDVHPYGAPTGGRAVVLTRDGSPLPGGMCATVTFDRGGHLVALCADLLSFDIELLEPSTLELLAHYRLPPRPSTFEALVKRDPSIVMTDTSGGAYFYLDAEDRVVLADSRQRILLIAHRRRPDGNWEFYLERAWDLSRAVPHDCMSLGNWFPAGECDPITAVLPDWRGFIWWVTRHGRIGTLDPRSGRVAEVRLAGEEIQNGFAADRRAVYIVSDHALYALRRGRSGRPRTIWREPYQRATRPKRGSIDQGSGTTPTLLGRRYIVITDNADERIHLLVYDRRLRATGPRLHCKVPLFQAGASATDNSAIAYGRSIIVENNAGYRNAIEQTDYRDVAGGIVRIDVSRGGCQVVWRSPEKAPSCVPKLSARTGLAFFYTFEAKSAGDPPRWFLAALDFRTGKTAYKIPVGTGRKLDNNWAPITIGPDGTVYVGTLAGLVAVRPQG